MEKKLDMENYFNNLDMELLEKRDESELSRCCLNYLNHSMSQEVILCRVCGMEIQENICNLPEKSYENKNNSHH
jgi:hypothetical protein